MRSQSLGEQGGATFPGTLIERVRNSDAGTIARIQVLGFRLLRYVEVPLSPFVVLVGPNASGKTTFLDVLAFLGDALTDGVDKAVTKRTEQFEDLTWMREGRTFEVALDVSLPKPLRSNGRPWCRYVVQFGRTRGKPGILGETLWLRPEAGPDEYKRPHASPFPVNLDAPPTLLRDAPKGGKWRVVVRKTEAGKDYFKSETGAWNIQFSVGPRKAALSNLPEDEERFPVSTWFRRFLMDGIQTLQLNSIAMRKPVSPLAPRQFEPDGSNLPLVVADLRKSNRKRYDDWVKHLQTILPDLEAVEIATREADRHQYLVLQYRSGLHAPSWLISDGTLRILALTLLAYVETKDSLFLVEEPENGLHPKALEPVFESLSSVYDGQLILATHNVMLLGLARPEDVLVFGKTPDGAADIVAGPEHPKLRRWHGEIDLGTMLASGILG